MLNPRIFLVVLFVLGAAMLLPLFGGDSGLSPVPAAWAAHACDADMDGHDKDSRRCGGDDPNDSDPCDPDPDAAACNPGSDGGLGSAIPLECVLDASWGDSKADTIKDDTLGSYKDAVDKVDCEIGGPSIPWPIRLAVGGGNGPLAKARQVDIDLDKPFDMGTFGGAEGSQFLDDLYPDIFRPAEGMDDMDTLGLQVRPYRLTQTVDSIHLLPAGEAYQMGMNFSIQKMGIDRFRISVASLWYPGNENFTGIACETGYEDAILANAPGGPMKDVWVYLWPDSDGDGLSDAYTVTTGTFDFDEDENVMLDDDGWPIVHADASWAAVCSALGPLVCGNPKAPSNCNFLGYVPVTFTMHAFMK